MAEYLIKDTTLTAIADAVRTKTETTDAILISDMASRINSIQSGSDLLNFEVVGGTTEPSNPKENTIWVNTSTPITSWIFSAVQPTNPEEGMIWIYTSTSSPITFNALKSNGISVHPISVKQFASSVWKIKTTKTYQNGLWKDWAFYMFKEGSGFADGFTGFENCSYSWGEQTYTDDLITLAQYYEAGYGGSSAVSKEPVDLTNYNTAYFDVESITCSGASGYSSDGYLGFANETDRLEEYHVMSASTQWHTFNDSNGTVSDTVFAVDISSLTGKYYAKCSYSCSDDDGTNCTFKIRNIYFV